MDLKNFFFIFFIFITLYGFLKKKEILIDKISYSDHKIIGAQNKSPVIIGGLYILIVYLFIFYSHSFILITSSIFITLLGLMSDKNILTSPKKRLIFQFLILLFLSYFESFHHFRLCHCCRSLHVDRPTFELHIRLPNCQPRALR